VVVTVGLRLIEDAQGLIVSAKAALGSPDSAQ
jgi:hypothetical protein